MKPYQQPEPLPATMDAPSDAALDAARAALEIIYTETGTQHPGAEPETAASSAAATARQWRTDGDDARRAYQNAETRAGSLEREIETIRAALDAVELEALDAGDIESPPDAYQQRADTIRQTIRATREALDALRQRRNDEADRMSEAARAARQCEREERQSRIDAEQYRAEAERERDAYAAALEALEAEAGTAGDPPTAYHPAERARRIKDLIRSQRADLEFQRLNLIAERQESRRP